jgi:DNA-binding transcriptional LysR family regulator
MPSVSVNRAAEMEVFAAVVERGGFSAAARALRMTPSAVSKLVGRLEARLGARLVNRSTRKFQLTAEGAAFHERSVGILADMDEAEREAAAGAMPRGRLRVNCNVPFGLHHLIPLVPGFVERHPDVCLDLVLSDQVVDLLDVRADVAIRVGPLLASRLMARKLAASRMVVVASAAYLERAGTPLGIEDLDRHVRLGFSFARSADGWPFRDGEREIRIRTSGDIQAGDGETMRRFALEGLGLARLACFHVGRDIEEGLLVPVLEAYNPGDVEDIHAIYLGQGGRLPARIRAFIDYLAGELKHRPWDAG